MARLYLTFKDNELTASVEGIATTDTIGLECVADFLGWDGFSKTVVFYQNPRKPYRVVVHADETLFEVPHEVLLSDAPLTIGAFGVNAEGKRKTSTVVGVNITKGMFDEKAVESIKPTPSEYEQMLAFMNAYMEAEKFVENVEVVAQKATKDAREEIDSATAAAIELAKEAVDEKSAEEQREIETVGETIIERAEDAAEAAEVSSVAAANSVGRISAVEKQLSNIEQSLTPSPFIVDDTVAYGKTVPANALPYAEVNEIGGMCAVKDGAVVSAPVTEVKSIGANFVDTERFYDVGNWEDVSTASSTNRYVFSLGVLPAGDYIADAANDTSGGLYFSIHKRSLDGTREAVAVVWQGTHQDAWRRKFTLTEPCEILVWVYTGYGVALGNYISNFYNVQAVRGDTDTAYEPYKSASLPIPAAIRNLNGYGLGAGEVSNTVDFDTGKYTRRVGIVDLGSVTWYYGNWGAKNVFSTYDFQAGGKCEAIKADTKNVVCSASFVGVGEIYNGTADNAFCVNAGSIRGIFSGYTDVASFKAAMSGVMLVYELAEPITEDVTDKLPLDNYIEVFENGTVFMENEHSLDVPNTITFSLPFEIGGGGGGGGGTGENGATFYPSVSSDGVISWRNDKGLSNPPPVNIKGKDGTNGAKGDKGDKGDTPVKGTDYFTPADKAEMVQEVLNALPNGDEVNY